MYRAIGLPGECTNCPLGCRKAVPIWGQSMVPLSDVKGIIISAYPGKEEKIQGKVLVEAAAYLNAGGFLRKAMRSLSKNPAIDNQFFFTNALSCPIPKEEVDLKSYLGVCGQWTQYEIGKCKAGCPILIGGGEALTQLFGPKSSINKMRNTDNLMLGNHPCVVTWNPVVGLKYMPNNEEGKPITPVPLFSHTDLFKRDLIKFMTLAGVMS